VASGCAHGLEADVWSIGCMLFTLLLGAPPFDASNPSKILSRVRLEEPVIPEAGLSPEARDLIKRMLRKNPNERIKIHGASGGARAR
jgi:polo-like kinase 4